MIDILLQSTCNSNLSTSVTCFFTAGPIVWFPIVALAVLTIICIVAVIYILAPLLGRNDIRVWARAKIYDALVTVVFALIFLGFATLALTINPVPAYQALGIVPNACNASAVNNIFALSSCDLYTFNQNVIYTSTGLYWLAIIGGFSPSFNFQPSVPDFPINTPTGWGLGVSFSIELIPIVFVHQYLVPYMQAYFTAVLVNQVIQILLSGAMLFFSLFLIIGLIARSFGITKSFGGAMIAFGIGLGFMFPLMVSITYGFLDTAMQNAQVILSNNFIGFTGIAGAALYVVQQWFALMPKLIASGCIVSFIANPSCLTAYTNAFTPLIVNGGFIAAGLILLPLLNLVIVDAFIVDFSRAIGERMDLFSILTRVI